MTILLDIGDKVSDEITIKRQVSEGVDTAGQTLDEAVMAKQTTKKEGGDADENQ